VPHTLRLRFELDRPVLDPCIGVHGLLNRALGNLDEQLGTDVARVFHDDQHNPSPVTVGFAPTSGFGPMSGASLACRIQVLREDLTPYLYEALCMVGEFKGQGPLSGKLVVSSTIDHTPYSVFQEMLEEEPVEKLKLRFHSPTTISTEGQFWAAALPSLIWRGLARRFTTHSGFDCPELPYELIDCKRQPHERHQVFLGKKTKGGKKVLLEAFSGVGVYELSRVTPDQARRIYMLARFAQWAGVGAKVGYGCGEVTMYRVQ
jgi:CRISPR/Cas system endoribonuclease Cas6 (RAMP superfamily)